MHQRAVRAEVFRQRAVAADDRQIEIQLAGDANRKVDAASGDQNNADAGIECAADRCGIAFGDAFFGIEESAVEIQSDQINPHEATPRVSGDEPRLLCL